MSGQRREWRRQCLDDLNEWERVFHRDTGLPFYRYPYGWTEELNIDGAFFVQLGGVETQGVSAAIARKDIVR